MDRKFKVDSSELLSRRRLLGNAVASPVLLLGVVAATGAAGETAIATPGKTTPGKASAATKCIDMNNLTASQQSLRESLGFKLDTADPKQHCSLCAFFTATEAGCGTCQLLTGGAVAVNSVCDSFAAKS